MSESHLKSKYSLPPKSLVLQTIRQFFQKEWSKVTEDDIDPQVIVGGYCNTVIKVERKVNASVDHEEPVCLVYREYGNQSNRGRNQDPNFLYDLYRGSIMEETLVFYEMSQRNQGPQLYGIHESGRLEEFIDCHTLTHEDMKDREIRRELAQRYANMNAMQLPVRDKHDFIEEAISSKFDKYTISERKKQLEDPKVISALRKYNIDVKSIDLPDFAEEFKWISSMRKKINSRKGISAIDCNYMNILVRNNPNVNQVRILLIDHESTWMGTRGDTIGCHFMNRTLRWASKDEKVIPNSYPTEEERTEFITDYLQELSKLISPLDPVFDSLHHVHMEADFGILKIILYFEFLFSNLSRIVEREEAFIQVFAHLTQLYADRKAFFLSKYSL